MSPRLAEITESNIGAMAACSSSPLFYMYEEPALNHHWLRHCSRFRELRLASKAENTAEAGLHRVLARHHLRTRDPTKARLFYVPVFEYSSKFVDASCNAASRANTSAERLEAGNASSAAAGVSLSSFAPPSGLADHRSRMVAARDALLASPFYLAHAGRDHIWGTTAFSAHGSSLSSRMAPLSSLLGCSAVGRYKAGGFSRKSAGGGCVVEVPYQAPLHVMRAVASMATPRGAAGDSGDSGSMSELSTSSSVGQRDSRRTTLLFFAGSLDVCCAGRQLRCAIGDLYVATHGMADVSIRPTGGGACTRRALQRVANLTAADGNASATMSSPVGRAALPSPGADAATATDASIGARRYVSGSVVERTAREMTQANFCLCPAGDTCVTSRLYTAIAAGCIPVVLCDPLTGAFAHAVPYSQFWIKYSTKRFLTRPTGLLDMLRRLDANATEIARRMRALRAHRADVLYDEPRSRVGTRFLEAVVLRCGVPSREGAGSDAGCAARGAPGKRNETAIHATCLRRAGLPTPLA